MSDQLGTTANNCATRSAAKIVVVGSYGVGLSLTMERMPEAGETVTGEQFSTGHGGKGSNQAVAAARLGATAVLCTAVGSDPFGEQAKALWADEGVDSTMVRTLPGSTMVGVILVDAAGENRIAIAPGVLADFTAECLDGLETALADADVLLVGLEIPVDTAHEALRIGRDAGVVTVLNPAPAPPAALPAGMLALVDHVTPNRTEAARLAGLPTRQRAARRSIGAACFADVGTAVLTLGGDGALIRHGGAVDKIDAVVAPERRRHHRSRRCVQRGVRRESRRPRRARSTPLGSPLAPRPGASPGARSSRRSRSGSRSGTGAAARHEASGILNAGSATRSRRSVTATGSWSSTPGFPIPSSSWRIDLARRRETFPTCAPSSTSSAPSDRRGITIADEVRRTIRRSTSWIATQWPDVDHRDVPHPELLSTAPRRAKAVVRTGAFDPWGNVLLTSGVDVPRWFERADVVVPDYYRDRLG